jgi:hypothetical protein
MKTPIKPLLPALLLLALPAEFHPQSLWKSKVFAALAPNLSSM